MSEYVDPSKIKFQSTLPVWGATRSCGRSSGLRSNFNPRSPCGERPFLMLPALPGNNFNPRSPCGERPHSDYSSSDTCHISIHAPRVGSDGSLPGTPGTTPLFQSTLPVWGATKYNRGTMFWAIFQSTLPVWGATNPFLAVLGDNRFQSTLPVWGATHLLRAIRPREPNFNPRSPCGERRSPGQERAGKG